jgi:hypothetical protein
MMEPSSQSGEAEAVILIKASPNAGQSSETVCCAGIDARGNWLRLFPVVFRRLDQAQQFRRWDRVRFRWRRPRSDFRIESRRVEEDSLEIVGSLKEGERARFLSSSIVTSTDREREQGRSLALLRAEIIEFKFERKPVAEIAAEQSRFDQLRRQQDLFSRQVGAYEACPFRFKYRYRSEDGDREGTCQDWETDATFFKWSKTYGEQGALDRMAERFGVKYPRNGMLLAMGTHSRWPDQWLINGVIRQDPITQLTLF